LVLNKLFLRKAVNVDLLRGFRTLRLLLFALIGGVVGLKERPDHLPVQVDYAVVNFAHRARDKILTVFELLVLLVEFGSYLLAQLVQA
jgi:hypothetical protein